MHIIVKIEKIKEMLHVTTAQGKVYKINCSTGAIIGLRGQELKNSPFWGEGAVVREYIPNFKKWQRFLRKGEFGTGYMTLQEIKLYWNRNVALNEKFIPYLDILDDTYALPNEIPKGYINYLKKNDLKISQSSYEDFIFEELIKNLTKKEQLRLNNLNRNLSPNQIRSLISNNELRKKFFTIIENSYKIFDTSSCYADLLDDIITHGMEYIDLTAGISDNKTIYSIIEQEQTEKNIIETEKKIEKLMSMNLSDEYCIKVPLTLQDFADEGKQQHNCVGHYYHDSIAMGENIIYFIREKSNPNKSYVTCRFHVPVSKTTESKVMQNHNAPKKIYQFIQKVVDIKIRELLTE